MGGGSAVSYAELHERVERTARRLAARGVGEGDRVATGLEPGLPWVELLHAVPRLGAILVPLNPRAEAPVLRRQVEAAGARLVVSEPLAGPEAHFEPVEPEPTRAHTLLFTSGTTGRPRPVALTHGNHEASARAVGRRLRLGPEDTWLAVLPVFHVGGLAVLLRAAAHGSRVLLHPRWDEGAVLTALGEVTRVSLVPTQLARLARGGRLHAPRLTTVLLGGGAARSSLLRWSAERGLPVVQTYGSTETASAVATRTVEEALRGAGARPLRGVELRIGEGEELLVRGDMVAPGARDAEGWLHTGDLARLGTDGRLLVLGRAREMIVTGGEKVAPETVEEALRAHPAVRDAGVVGRPDRDWGEAVIAWVVIDIVGAGDEELLAFLRTRLAPHELPKAIHRVGALPRNAAGKLQRHLL